LNELVRVIQLRLYTPLEKTLQLHPDLKRLYERA
jgi:hypothetical protein